MILINNKQTQQSPEEALSSSVLQQAAVNSSFAALLHRAELRHTSRIQHQQLIAVRNGVQSVRNGQRRAIHKLAPDDDLQFFVCRGVDARGGFINKQYFGAFENGASNAEQLALPSTHVRAIF
jgi:hypothetical protein